MTNAYCRTWNMARKLKSFEKEKNIYTVQPGVWQEKRI
jgi:hypothetical protein